MWDELATLTGFIPSFIYHRWFVDDPQQTLPPALTLPRVDEGIMVPLVYGRVRVRTPILVWSGNYLVPGQTFTRRQDGSTQTTDHYSVDALFLIGLPFFGGGAFFLNAWAGDTPITSGIGASFGNGQQFTMNPGPTSTEVSIRGVFYAGASTTDVTNGIASTTPPGNTWQDGISYANVTSFANALFQANVDATLFPGFRSQITLAGHFAIGVTPDMPSFSFEVRTLSTGSKSDLGHSLSDDADPAAVIYDLLTGKFGKLGLPTSIIDKASFQAASLTLFNEGNGYSRAIDQSGDASSMIQEILKQIDGVLYQSPATGLITLKLVRNDYDVNSLDDINPSNTTAPSDGWYSVQGWSELPNQVVVSYSQRGNDYQTTPIVAQNPSAIAASKGRLRKLSIQYPGCCTPALARALCARELAANSRPLVRATVKVNRSFYQKNLGDVVTLTWPELGVNKMVMRIARVNRGRPGSGTITLDLIRDITGVSVNVAFPAA